MQLWKLLQRPQDLTTEDTYKQYDLILLWRQSVCFISFSSFGDDMSVNGEGEKTTKVYDFHSVLSTSRRFRTS